MLRELQEQIKQLKAMLGGKMPPDMSSLGKPAEEKRASPNRRSSANDDDFREQMKREKATEIAEVERRLKDDYESKLSAIEQKAGTGTLGDAELEQELMQVEQEYEHNRTSAKTAIIKKLDQNELELQDMEMEGDEIQATTSGRPATVIGADGRPVVALVSASEGCLLGISAVLCDAISAATEFRANVLDLNVRQEYLQCCVTSSVQRQSLGSMCWIFMYARNTCGLLFSILDAFLGCTSAPCPFSTTLHLISFPAIITASVWFLHTISCQQMVFTSKLRCQKMDSCDQCSGPTSNIFRSPVQTADLPLRLIKAMVAMVDPEVVVLFHLDQ
jgi:hypothetical protein